MFYKVMKPLHNRAHSSSNIQAKISCLFEVFLDYLEEKDVISPTCPYHTPSHQG
jgi:hypothetical protein